MNDDLLTTMLLLPWILVRRAWINVRLAELELRVRFIDLYYGVRKWWLRRRQRHLSVYRSRSANLELSDVDSIKQRDDWLREYDRRMAEWEGQ